MQAVSRGAKRHKVQAGSVTFLQRFGSSINLNLHFHSCPFCWRGALHLISAITQEEVTTRILRHLKLASVPPPIAPARCRQEILAFDEAASGIGL